MGAFQTDSTAESRLTTDRETIREWAREHDAVPVRHAGVDEGADSVGDERGDGVGDEGAGGVGIVPVRELHEDHEAIRWDEFFSRIERGGLAVVHHEASDRSSFDVVERDVALARPVDGGTVAGRTAGARVVERPTVEEATVETEVVDREAVEEEIVDLELLAREAGDCVLIVVDPGNENDRVDASWFEPGHRDSDAFDVEIEVGERWAVTREVLERLTVESRVVNADVAGGEGTVDVEAVQRTLLRSDLVDPGDSPAKAAGRGPVDSGFRGRRSVRTRVLQRRTVEDEACLRRRLTGEITASETLEADSLDGRAVESELVDADRVAAKGTRPFEHDCERKERREE